MKINFIITFILIVHSSFAQKINTITPSSVATSGGNIVVVGSNFGTSSGKIYFNGQEIAINSWSDNLINVRIPAGIGTNIPIQVEKANGTLSNLFIRFSYDFPIVQSATPLTGSASGGTLVTLTGENFGPTGTSYVTVGGVKATILSQTHTEIQLLTPSGTGNSALVVWVGDQSDFVTFQYQDVIGTLLPLEWLDFSAFHTEGGIHLIWLTANEQNTAFFDIQRSKDGIHWESLDQVKSLGKGGGYYEWVDKSPLSSVAYYRLRQLDFDTKFAYSSTISVRNETKTELYASPNPTRDFVRLEGFTENAEMTLFNNIGQVISRKILRGASEDINMSDLTTGVYFIQVQKGKDVARVKVVKIN
ncbi:MAG: IPT/TIG domain-containing protein [Saprospiraceae bacterium]|nr:IPT/TIG domain-containing protein [Saprospiraceae bacterium]